MRHGLRMGAWLLATVVSMCATLILIASALSRPRIGPYFFLQAPVLVDETGVLHVSMVRPRARSLRDLDEEYAIDGDLILARRYDHRGWLAHTRTDVYVEFGHSRLTSAGEEQQAQWRAQLVQHPSIGESLDYLTDAEFDSLLTSGETVRTSWRAEGYVKNILIILLVMTVPWCAKRAWATWRSYEMYLATARPGPHCEYSLAGLPDHCTSCPECGELIPHYRLTEIT